MHNWSVDEKVFKKLDPEGYKILRIQQLINYGLDGEKLFRQEVKKYWDRLYLDPNTKKYLKFLLWPKNKKS